MKPGGLSRDRLAAGRSSLWRGAWIETAVKGDVAGWNCGSTVAPLYGEGRGLKRLDSTTFSVAKRRSSLWRGAWIETRSSSHHNCAASLVAPLYGEGRGLKRDEIGTVSRRLRSRSSLWRGAWIETQECSAGPVARRVAPLYGEGRGLKLDRTLWRLGTPHQVAPLYGEGRGLKPSITPLPASRYVARRSSLWRGAWIETALPVSRLAHSHSRSSLWRGAWIETPLPTCASNMTVGTRRSSLWRGAWIETIRPTRLC